MGKILDILKEKSMAFGSGAVVGAGGIAAFAGTSDVGMYIVVAFGNLIKAGASLAGF